MYEENDINDLCKNIQQWIDREENNKPEKRDELLTKIFRIFYYAASAERTGKCSVLKVLDSVSEWRFYTFVGDKEKPVRVVKKRKSGKEE